MDLDQRAEQMIQLHNDSVNRWAEKQDDDGIKLDRSYYLDYVAKEFKPDEELTIVYLYVAVDDELNRLQLLGVWEEELLVHLTSEIDTSWREEWYAEYPSGMINEDNPWKRHGVFAADRK